MNNYLAVGFFTFFIGIAFCYLFIPRIEVVKIEHLVGADKVNECVSQGGFFSAGINGWDEFEAKCKFPERVDTFMMW